MVIDKTQSAQRVIEDYAVSDETNLIDFGAGHSVQDNPALMEKLTAALAPYPDVILLLPSPDPVESAQILRGRGGPFTSVGVGFYDYFLTHPSNFALAKRIIYPKDKTPAEIKEEILEKSFITFPGVVYKRFNR